MTDRSPSTIGTQHCANHTAREAVARCPECERFYCRECTVEHDYRMICAGCLASLAGEAESARRRAGASRWNRVPVFPLLQALVGIGFVWVMVYLAAQLLIELPSAFHDGVYLENMVDALSGKS